MARGRRAATTPPSVVYPLWRKDQAGNPHSDRGLNATERPLNERGPTPLDFLSNRRKWKGRHSRRGKWGESGRLSPREPPGGYASPCSSDAPAATCPTPLHECRRVTTAAGDRACGGISPVSAILLGGRSLLSLSLGGRSLLSLSPSFSYPPFPPFISHPPSLSLSPPPHPLASPAPYPSHHSTTTRAPAASPTSTGTPAPPSLHHYHGG